MPLRGANIWIHCLQAYYLATPAFYLLDRFFDINLRASVFDHKPALNLAYYGMSFLCGIFTVIFRKAAILIGLFESTLNIVLLIVGFGMNYAAMINSAANDSPDLPQRISDMQMTGNFILSAYILMVSFYTNPYMRRAQGLDE
jgi:hypothetical protein